MTATASGNLPVARNFIALASGDELAPSLLGKYREVLMSSLITSCGLDALIFRNDEVNGHVDTLHNVEESQKGGGKPVFKKKEHQDAYDARGDYNNGKKYREDKKYKDSRGEYAKLQEDGKLVSGYTNNNIAQGKAVDVEHRISAHEIHNDGRSALSKVDPVKLANSDSNLTPLEAHINRAKGKKSPEEFVTYSKDEVFEKRNSAIGKIDKKIADGTASDAEIYAKEVIKENIKDFESVDEDLVIDGANVVRKEISSAHSVYYYSKDFLSTTAREAGRSGLKMGGKQALGLILMEVSIAVQEEFPAMLEEWRQAPDWKSRLDPRPLLERVAAALRAAWARVKEKANHLFKAAASGFAAGMMAEIMTTVINIFTGTAKSVMRMLRNFWAGIVESVKILTFNPDNLGAEDKLAAVMHILSVAIGGMIQPVVAEAIDKLILTHGPLLPGFVREVLSQFAGAAIGGIVSVSLVYAIDNSPVVAAIVAAARQAGAFTDAVYQSVAHLTGLTWQALKAAPAALNEIMKSPAANLAAFIVCPPLGAAMLAYRAVSSMSENAAHQRVGLERIEMRLSSLKTTIHSGLQTIETLVRENNAMLHFVIEKQDQQLLMLKEIREEIAQGFDQMRIHVRETALEAADRVALQALQNTLNALLTQYRDCASVLALGKMPVDRDLGSIGALSIELNAQYQTCFNAQPEGAPARLPLLTGMAFALCARRDAMAMIGEDIAICEAAARRLAELVQNELHALSSNASFWQLTESNSWLIGQYVVLRRALIAMPEDEVRFSVTANDGGSYTMPELSILGWNDGLDAARDLFDQMKTDPDQDILKLQSAPERDAWRILYGLPRGQMVREVPMATFREKLGIPDSIHLSQTASKLLELVPDMIEDNRKLLARELT